MAWPARPRGVAILARSSGSIGAFCPCPLAPVGILPQIGVSMIPGCTELTRTPSPREAHSIAIALANRRTPPLVAQYPANVAEPRKPAIDDVITIEPPPDFLINGRQYFTDRNTPSRLIAVWRRQSARLIS